MKAKDKARRSQMAAEADALERRHRQVIKEAEEYKENIRKLLVKEED